MSLSLATRLALYTRPSAVAHQQGRRDTKNTLPIELFVECRKFGNQTQRNRQTLQLIVGP
jgi:hypothetical protein